MLLAGGTFDGRFSAAGARKAALLMTVYGVASSDLGQALRMALVASLAVLALAQAMAVRSLRQERSG